MTPTLSAPTLPIPSLPTPSLLDSLFYRCNNDYAGLQLNKKSRINFSSCTFCLQLSVSLHCNSVHNYNIILLCMLSLPSIIAITIINYTYTIINFYYYTSSFYATLTPCPPACTTYVQSCNSLL